MTELSTTFVFHNIDRSPISNDVLFNIRREVANAIERCGFGEVIESDSDKFRNVYCSPTSDVYITPEEELVISFYFTIPSQFGDVFRLVTTEVVNLSAWVRNEYIRIYFSAQTTIV